MDFLDGGSCTSFPENWYQWHLYKGFIPAWRKVYIGDCCKKHDGEEDYKGCHAHDFAKCVLELRLVGGIVIFSVASIACWIKYPSNEFKGI